MKEEKRRQILELFNRFANEEQCSSFAVEALYGQLMGILQEEEQPEFNIQDDGGE